MSDGGASLTVKTVRNVAWLGGTQAIRQLIGILTTLLVARFLQPRDYGIFAMTLFINELAQLLVDFGIGSALVQRKEVSRALLSTCFWINVGVGVCAGVLVVAGGPYAALYFKQPVIAQLLYVAAANLAVSAVAVLPQALLARELAFNHVATGTMIGSLVAAISTLAMAAAGFGVWALACQPLVGTTINLAYLLYRARWYPALTFDLQAVRGMLKFSGHLLFSNILGHVTRNFLHVIIGPIMGAAATGAISMAQTVAWLPIAQFTAAAVRAIYPAFAKVQDSKERMEAGLLRALEVVTLFAFPTLMGLGVLAEDAMPALFGAQWRPAAPLVSVFCVLSIIQSVTFLSTSTLLASGRSDVPMRLALISLPLVAGTLWWLRNTNVLAVSLGMITVYGFVAVLGFAIALRNLGGSRRAMFAVVSRPLVSAGVMAVVVWCARSSVSGFPPWPRLIMLVTLGAGVYAAVTWLVNRNALLGVLSLLNETFRPASGTRGTDAAATPASTL